MKSRRISSGVGLRPQDAKVTTARSKNKNFFILIDVLLICEVKVRKKTELTKKLAQF